MGFLQPTYMVPVSGASIMGDMSSNQHDVVVVNVYRVTSNVVFDRESRDDYRLTVVCADFGTPRLSSQTIIRVKITDENDVTPIFDRKLYQATITENNDIGDTIIQVRTQAACAGAAAPL